MTATLPKATELVLTPGEASPEVSRMHGAVLGALVAGDIPLAQRLAADLLDHIELVERVQPSEKTQMLVDFVIIVS